MKVLGGMLAIALIPVLFGGCGEVCDSDRDPPLSWDNFGRAYVDNYCNGCHSVLLDGYERHDAPV